MRIRYVVSAFGVQACRGSNSTRPPSTVPRVAPSAERAFKFWRHKCREPDVGGRAGPLIDDADFIARLAADFDRISDMGHLEYERGHPLDINGLFMFARDVAIGPAFDQ